MENEFFGRVLSILFLLLVGTVIFIPKLLTSVLFFLVPVVLISAACSFIMVTACEEKPESGEYEFSNLLAFFVGIGILVWGLLFKFGVRILNEKGEVMVSSFGGSLYRFYNDTGRFMHKFSYQSWGRSLSYQPEIYDAASFSWMISFALLIGTPLGCLMLIHLGGGKLRPSTSLLGQKLLEVKSERSELAQSLYREENRNKNLEEVLRQTREELKRMQEDQAAFSSNQGEEVKEKPEREDENLPDSDTF